MKLDHGVAKDPMPGESEAKGEQEKNNEERYQIRRCELQRAPEQAQ